MVKPEGIERRRVGAVLKRRWPWLLLPLVLVGGAAAYLAAVQEPVYRATARVLLDESAAQDAVNPGAGRNTTFSRRLVANEINLAAADEVTTVVRAELGLDADEPLPEGTVIGDEDADVLFFEFSGRRPETAAQNTNTWATAYVDVRANRLTSSIERVQAEVEARIADLQADRTNLRAELGRLESQLAANTAEAEQLAVAAPGAGLELAQQRRTLERQINRESRTIAGELGVIDNQIASKLADVATLELNAKLAADGGAVVVQAAVPPDATSSLIPSVIVTIGLLLALAIGLGLILLVENLSQVVHVASDVEELGLTVLGTIPTAQHLTHDHALATVAFRVPSSAVADAHQRLRSSVEYALAGRDPGSVGDNNADQKRNVVLVTSPGEGEGRTTTASNLALTLANTGNEVRLVDADLVSPQLHEIYSLDRAPGFSDIVAGSTTTFEAEIDFPPLAETMSTVPAGTRPSDANAGLAAPAATKALKVIGESVDLVIVDGPSLSRSPELFSVVAQAAGTILVARSGRTKRDDLLLAADDIRRSGGHVLGVVVNFAAGGGASGDYAVAPVSEPVVSESSKDSVVLG